MYFNTNFFHCFSNQFGWSHWSPKEEFDCIAHHIIILTLPKLELLITDFAFLFLFWADQPASLWLWVGLHIYNAPLSLHSSHDPWLLANVQQSIAPSRCCHRLCSCFLGCYTKAFLSNLIRGLFDTRLRLSVTFHPMAPLWTAFVGCSGPSRVVLGWSTL